MKPQIRVWITFILALVALAGVVGLVRGTNQPAQEAAQAASAPEAEQQAVAQTTPSADDLHIQQLRELLQRSNLSEEGRSSLQEKLEIAERLAAQQAAGKATGAERRAAKDPGSAASFWQPPEQALTEGIFEGSQGMIRPSTADISNVWQGERGGVVYQVFAGATPEETPRGLVIVIAIASDKPTGEHQFYLDPDEPARLRILEVQDQRLLLEDDQGGRKFFDLTSRTFSH